MKLKNLGFKDFSRPYIVAQNICGHLQPAKIGSYLCLQDEQGHHFFGELPILPSFLPLSLDEVKEELLAILPDTIELPETPDWTRSLFGASLSRPNSVQALFSLECALFNFYYPNLSIELPRTVLIQSARELSSLPEHHHLKIKINRLDLLLEGQMIKDYLARFPQAKVRLDANRTLSQEQLSQCFEMFKDVQQQIEFFEEPTKIFEKRSDIPSAMDESFNLAMLDQDHFMVLKPTLHLGIVKSLKLIKKYPHRVVVSSTYETEEGIAPLFYLAQSSQLSPGLDTLSAFTDLKNINISQDSIRFDRTFC